jgi:hypothetical protein
MRANAVGGRTTGGRTLGGRSFGRTMGRGRTAEPTRGLGRMVENFLRRR